MARPKLLGRDDLFGPALARCIHKRERTITDVAKQIGVHPVKLRSTLSPSAPRTRVGYTKLIHIMHLLDITLEELTEEAEAYADERGICLHS